MVERLPKLAFAFWQPAAARRLLLPLWLLAMAARAPAAPLPAPTAAPPAYVARAQLVDVVRAFVSSGDAPMPGAGVRAFQDTETRAGGTERFEIRWYANPPGIPPGVVVWLESIQEHSPVVKNHYLRVGEKSEGHVRSVIEIPPDEIQQAGRVMKWRIRVVWRGRLLASRTSPNWDG